MKKIKGHAMQIDDRYPNISCFNLNAWMSVSEENSPMCQLEDLMLNIKNILPTALSYEQGGSRAYQLGQEDSDFDSFVVHRTLKLSESERLFILQQIYARLLTLKHELSKVSHNIPEVNLIDLKNVLANMEVSLVHARFPIISVQIPDCPDLQIGVSAENYSQHSTYVALWTKVSSDHMFSQAYRDIRDYLREAHLLDSFSGKLNSNFIRHLCAACRFYAEDVWDFAIQDSTSRPMLVETCVQYRERIITYMSKETSDRMFDMMTGQPTSNTTFTDVNFEGVRSSLRQTPFVSGVYKRSSVRITNSGRKLSLAAMMSMNPPEAKSKSVKFAEPGKPLYPEIPIFDDARPTFVDDISDIEDGFSVVSSNKNSAEHTKKYAQTLISTKSFAQTVSLTPKDLFMRIGDRDRSLWFLQFSQNVMPIYIEKSHALAPSFLKTFHTFCASNQQVKSNYMKVDPLILYRELVNAGVSEEKAYVILESDPIPQMLRPYIG
jgi:hypothetical protein